MPISLAMPPAAELRLNIAANPIISL
jgi:hypothetical protein